MVRPHRAVRSQPVSATTPPLFLNPVLPQLSWCPCIPARGAKRPTADAPVLQEPGRPLLNTSCNGICRHMSPKTCRGSTERPLGPVCARSEGQGSSLARAETLLLFGANNQLPRNLAPENPHGAKHTHPRRPNSTYSGYKSLSTRHCGPRPRSGAPNLLLAKHTILLTRSTLNNKVGHEWAQTIL
jgi:hypothetical protein